MIKIKASITDFNLPHFIENNVHDDATKNRSYDWEEYFRSKLILKINNVIGNDWMLDFSQTPEDSWLVDISSCKDLVSASKIKNIVINTLEEIKVEVFLNGKPVA